MRIAINGVGIAGPTLAYWLRRAGHEILLVEQSPRLRTGGYAIDFWGVGYDIVEKMGLLPRVLATGFHVQGMRYVDRRGAVRGAFPVDVFRRVTRDRFLEIRRTDLAEILFDALDGEVETIFGDSVAGVVDTGAALHLTFARAAPRDVDLLIGADGLHSRIRQLVLGPQTDFEVSLGYHLAAFEVGAYSANDELVAVSHAVAGRQVTQVSLPDERTLFLFVFRDEYLTGNEPTSDADRKAAVAEAFADMGWECPRILAAMREVDGIYFDRVSQIRMPRWTRGRTALVGDAAACASLLAGEGTGFAMAEAYVLAAELARCARDHGAAFARYEQRMMPFLAGKQRAAAKLAATFAPRTNFGVVLRDRLSSLLRVPSIARLLVGRALRDDLVLPDDPFERSAPAAPGRDRRP